MTRIHEGLEDKDFEMPSSVEKASVCSETGLLPRAGCPTITEYFDISSLPTEYCDQHFYESSYDYDEDYYNEDTDTDSAAEAIPSAAPDSTDSTDNGDSTDNTDSTDNGSGDNTDDSGNGDNGDDSGGGDTGDDTGDDGSGDDGGGSEEDPVEYY